MRVAVVEDDPLQLEMLQRVLEQMGHGCAPFSLGQDCLRALQNESFDLLIVDWELPDTSGPAIIRWARQHLPAEMPVLFITHRSEERDLVEGLGCGADDFMVKPLRIEELKARISALLRRAYPNCDDDVQRFGPYTCTRSDLTVAFADEVVTMTYREFMLALLLFQNAGRLLSREYLRDAVWGQNAQVQSRSLDTHVSRLRQLLHMRPGSGHSISAIYGLGYRLEVD